MAGLIADLPVVDAVRGVAMSKPEWFGLALLGCGAGLGFLLGGTFGLALACVCLVVGLVLIVAREALGTRRPSAAVKSSSRTTSHLLVLLKEIHARPLRNGKFQEISDPKQAGLQFETFVHCWLLNDTDERVGVASLRFSLAKPGEAPQLLERVTGDLENWRVGRLRDEIDSWGVRYLQAAQEVMSELRTEEPLEGGSTRQGWLHFRAEGITPGEMTDAKLELEVLDSHLNSHLGEWKGRLQLPGRVWPFRAEPSPRAAPVSSEGETASIPADTLSQFGTAN